MKKIPLILVLVILASFAWQNSDFSEWSDATDSNAGSDLARAFENRQSNLPVGGAGEVLTVLPDDNDGSRHQRFILRLDSGQTLLVAHNIDLAPRISSLKTGDSVEFYGEYEWNAKGGVIHWTHDDPRGNHVPGWLKHHGKMYK